MKKDQNYFHILKTIEEDESVSQRKLSSQMELNVASVNFALKSLIQKGYVTKEGVNQRRTKYYITPEGMREKTNLAYMFYGQNIPYYREVKQDLDSRIEKATNGTKADIAIYGTSMRSEMTYVVVSKKGLNFLGFFHEESELTNEKIFGHDINGINSIDNDGEYLLLLTEEISDEKRIDLEAKNVNVLDLVS